MPGEPPSGRQFQIRRGGQRAVVTEVGATLREYTIDDEPVVDGFAGDAMADGGRGQPLLPWPNRLADGQYTFNGQSLQLPIDELSRHNASHGLTRWLNWRAADHDEQRVALEHVLHPRPGYPFTLALEIEYALSDQGLTVRTTATNRGARALPYGAGFHPYLTVGTPRVDQALLQLPAARVLLTDERLIPTGEQRSIQGTELDFLEARPIGAARIDGCFTGLLRDDDRSATARLRAPDGGRAVSVWMDSSFHYIQVFTGDTLPPERQRQGVAIEPMTCPPNAFRTGVDVVRLEPDQSHTCSWGISSQLVNSFPSAR